LKENIMSAQNRGVTPAKSTEGSAKKEPFRRSKEVTDIWAGNPYPSGHPKNIEIAENFKREQRKKLNSRFTGSPMKMRLADYDKEKVSMETSAAVASPPRTFAADRATTTAPVTDLHSEFEAKSKCLAVIQGGATIWSGEDDGSVVIRNGFTGDITKTLHMRPAGESEEESELVTVERLFPLEGHMFMGFSDGSVRVFDSLVVTIVRQSELHKAPVKFFQQLSDGTVVSGSTDGHLVLYDDYREEAGGTGTYFEVIRECDLESELTAMASLGTDIFVGSGNGVVRAIDAADLGTFMKFEVGDSSDAITALQRAEGSIVVGTSKGVIKIFKYNERTKAAPSLVKELTYHVAGNAITSLVYDSRTQRMWSCDSKGFFKSWDVRSDTNYILRNEIEVGASVIDIAFKVNMDAVRVWTLASNGINLAWWSEFSRTEFEMQQAIDDMQVIIEDDEQQLAKWKNQIADVERVDNHRRSRCLEALASMTSNGLRQIYFWKWRKWMKLREHQRKREIFAHTLASTTEKGLARIYYLRLFTFWQQNKLQRQKLGIAQNLLCSTKKGIQRVYWRKLVDYKNKEKNRVKKLQMAEALMATTNSGLMRLSYKKFCAFHDRRKFRRKRIQVAENLLRGSDVGLLRLYYFKFLANHTARKASNKRQALIDSMGRTSEVGLLRIYYAKLQRNIRLQKGKRQRKNVADLLMANTDRGLLFLYYRKLQQIHADGAEARKKREIEENEKLLAELEVKYKQMETRIERTKKLHALVDNKNELQKKKEERLRRIQELEQSLITLQEKIKNKEANDKRHADITAQLVETMSQLKCRALNFDGDYSLITKTVDRAGTMERGAVRSFLTAHMDVKRTIVSELGEQPKKKNDDDDTDLTYTWGKTDTSVRAAVAKFPPHTYTVILEAIKKMVIAFDILKPENLQDIETDDEIVANANGFIVMFDYIVEQKAKRKR
jgi:WD40 repeat protein